jgi:hypothetical protein
MRLVLPALLLSACPAAAGVEDAEHGAIVSAKAQKTCCGTMSTFGTPLCLTMRLVLPVLLLAACSAAPAPPAGAEDAQPGVQRLLHVLA